MIYNIKRFLYFLFVDIIRWRPLMLRSTHNRIVAEISKSHAEMEDRYWEQASKTLNYERLYKDLLKK